MNDSGTSGSICAETVPSRDFEDTRRDLIALRVKHGANTPIGHRCSNIIELIQQPELPTHLIQRQMAELTELRTSKVPNGDPA